MSFQNWVEAELDEYFLSILLKEGQLIYAVMDKVLPKMLLGENNRILYKTMLVLADKGVDPSRILVKSILIKGNSYNKIGGDDYIKQLLLLNINSDSLDGIVAEIIDNYRKRSLITIGGSIPQLVETHPTIDVINGLSRRLDDLVVIGNDSKIIRLSERLDESIRLIEERRKNPGLQGVTTGFSCINAHTTGYLPSEMWFIGARPSMGKTTFLLKSLFEVAKTDTPVLLINKEMSPLMLNERLYSMITRVPLQKIRSGHVDDNDVEKIKDAKSLLETLPFYIDNNWDYIGNENHIYSVIRRYNQLENIKVVGIDYIQLLVPRSSESTHELGSLSRRIKLLSGELEITTIVLSQLNRKVEDREDKRPIMSDLRQSGNLEEDADYMVGLYRDELYRTNSPDQGKIEFIIRKARNAPVGSYDLNYDGATVNIYDAKDLTTEFAV